jgi:hypothetical protein
MAADTWRRGQNRWAARLPGWSFPLAQRYPVTSKRNVPSLHRVAHLRCRRTILEGFSGCAGATSAPAAYATSLSLAPCELGPFELTTGLGSAAYASSPPVLSVSTAAKLEGAF